MAIFYFAKFSEDGSEREQWELHNRIQTGNTIWRLSPTPAILPGNEAIRPVGIFSSSAG